MPVFPLLVIDRIVTLYCSSVFTAVPMVRTEQGEWVESFPCFSTTHQDPPSPSDILRLAQLLSKVYFLSNPMIETDNTSVYAPEDPAIGAATLWSITWFTNRSVRLFPETLSIQKYPEGEVTSWAPGLGQSFIEPPATFAKIAIRIACPEYKKGKLL